MSQEVDDFSDLIGEMLEDEKYDFASTTLTGIRVTVHQTQRVTPGQRQAVENIRASKDDESSRPSKNWKRRYEGQ